MEPRYICLVCHSFHPERIGVSEADFKAGKNICREEKCMQKGKPLSPVNYCAQCNYIYRKNFKHNHSKGFEFYFWGKDANFGQPAETEQDSGTHFTIEMMLRYKGKFVAVRRPAGYPGHQLPPKANKFPKGCLYFCHGLPRWGESVEQAVRRTVKSQLAVPVKNFSVVDLTMEKYPDALHPDGKKQWAITLFVAVELEDLPKTSGQVSEVVQFDLKHIPQDMGWWEVDELRAFVEKNKIDFNLRN